MARPLCFSDLLDMRRAAAPVVSPDGTTVVFAATQPNLEENRNETHLYRVPVNGGEVVQLTQQGTRNADPAFSPDGNWLAFTSNRKDGNQIWVLPASGGEARRITEWPLETGRPVWFPDGKRLLVTATVYTDTNESGAVKEREESLQNKKSHPKVIDDLMFRHWDAWSDDKLDHVFVVDLESGAMHDLTPGPYPVPPRALGGHPDYAVSPDGKEVCFVSLRDDAQAVSTNLNLWTVSPEGGEPVRLSPGEGVNSHPVYSPDGSQLAYLAMPRAGYEADRCALMTVSRPGGEVRELMPDFSESAGVPVWSEDGSQIVFDAQDQGRTRIFAVSSEGGMPEPLTEGATDIGPALAKGGDVVFARQTVSAPPEIFAWSKAKGVRALTDLNDGVLGDLELTGAEDFRFEGAEGREVHGMLVKPPGFQPGRRYPVVFLIHGGPQGMFGLDFHERWNAQLFASPGFVVVMINPRGSTGYGQDFCDAIRGEWGRNCYQDLIKGFDHVLATYDFVDPDRTAAAGASFGGYMVNWMAGQTDRFKCLISHDGIFNTEMMGFSTDELWFTEWEFGGLPWEQPEQYTQWSPHRHVETMKTPMLIIQGEQDFRCPVSESLPLFTALQRKGVPSRLLYLEDEGHWVLKPQNREVWYAKVLGWLEEYLKG